MNRAVLLVCAQNLVITIVLAGGRVLLTLYALDIGASAAQVGAVISVLYLVPAVVSWPVAIVADRLGARWIIAAGSAVNALALLLPVYSPTLTALCIGAIGIGLGIGLSNVVGQNLVGVLSTPETRTQNFGNYTLAGGIANFIGPLVVGIAIDHVGFERASLIMAGTAAFSVVLMLAGGGILPRGAAQVKKGGGKFIGLTDPVMRRVLYIAAIGQIGLDAYMTFMPVYAHGIGLSASATGTALAIMSLAAVAVRMGMTPLLRTLGEEKAMVTAFVSGAAAFVLLPLFQAVLAIMVISFVFGVFMGLTQPLIMLMLFNSSPPGRGGEMLGLRLSINNVTRVISPAVFGATARVLGLAPLFIASGALMCLGVWLCRAHAKGARAT